MPHPEIQKFPKNFRDNLAKELRLTKEIASVKEKMAKTNDSNVIAANEKRIEQLERERIGVQKLIAKTNEQYDAQARIAKLNSVAETSQSKLKPSILNGQVSYIVKPRLYSKNIKISRKEVALQTIRQILRR